MTIDISNNDPRISYSVASGVTQTTFAVPFEFFDDSDLNVYVDGVLKTITTDYTLTGGDGSTGTVTMTVVGASGGSTVSVTRDTTIERITDFTAGVDINRAALNTQLDTLTAISADVKDLAERAIRVEDVEVAPSLVLPSIADRSGKTLAFNSTTGAIEAGPSIGDVQTVSAASADIATLADIEDGTDATDAIQTVASISGNVATVSGISANVTTVAGISSDVTAVAGDEADIGTVSTNISNVNTVAGISANVTTVAGDTTSINTVAGDSADIGTVATNIADVNTAASNITEIQNASTNAATATTKAAEASTSATNAATSETNAATSETNAATSETNAATSATAAASSAASAQASKDAALEALDSFDDRYLGQKAADPTVDNDGDALMSGALYYNTTDDIMKVYDGSLWVAAYASLSGAMFGANNLSDVADVAGSRSNLGLGTAATTASSDYATAAQGALADTATQPADLGTAATTDSTDYATAAQGTLADSAVQPNDSPTFAGLTLDSGSSSPVILQDSTGTNGYQLRANVSSSSDFGFLLEDLSGSNIARFDSNGDISFYEGTGTTAKFVWDASAESLGIGESSPSSPLHVNGGGTNNVAIFESTDATVNIKFEDSDQTQGVFVGAKGDDFYVQAGGSEKLRVKNSGNVGIGTSSPDSALHVQNAGTGAAGTIKMGLDYHGFVEQSLNNLNIISNGDQEYRAGLGTNNGSGSIVFKTASGTTGNTERLRIDSSGNLLVGTTSGSDKITVNGTVSATSFSGDGSALTGIDASPSTSYGAVGTYAVFSCTVDNIAIGSTTPGNTLRRKNDEGDGFGTISGTGSTSTAAGTWRVMGNHRTLVTTDGANSVYAANLFLRIS